MYVYRVFLVKCRMIKEHMLSVKCSFYQKLWFSFVFVFISVRYLRTNQPVSGYRWWFILGQKINIINNISGTYLKGVCKEIMVEHRPVLATNIHNDFTEFVSDEIGHRFVLSKQEFWKTAADLHLVLWSHANPHLVHQVLKVKRNDQPLKLCLKEEKHTQLHK